MLLVILISGDCVQVQPKRRSWSNKCQQTKDSYGGTSSLYERHDWKHLQTQICLNCFQPHGRAEGESETRDRFCEIETTAFILWTLQRIWHRRRATLPQEPSDQVQREGRRKGRRSAAKDKHPGGFCLLQVSQFPCNWLPQTKGLGFLALTLISYKINNKNVLFSPMDVQRERVRQETGGQSILLWRLFCLHCWSAFRFSCRETKCRSAMIISWSATGSARRMGRHAQTKRDQAPDWRWRESKLQNLETNYKKFPRVWNCPKLKI